MSWFLVSFLAACVGLSVTFKKCLFLEWCLKMSNELESFIQQHKAKLAQEKSDLQQVCGLCIFVEGVTWHVINVINVINRLFFSSSVSAHSVKKRSVLIVSDIQDPPVPQILPATDPLLPTGLQPSRTPHHSAFCFSFSLSFLVDACVGLNWLSAGFLSPVIQIESFNCTVV